MSGGHEGLSESGEGVKGGRLEQSNEGSLEDQIGLARVENFERLIEDIEGGELESRVERFKKSTCKIMQPAEARE